MKYRVKPEQVHVIVFCFFALAAGCRGISEFAYERLVSVGVSPQQIEQHAVILQPSHICTAAGENCSDPENVVSPDRQPMDIGYQPPYGTAP